MATPERGPLILCMLNAIGEEVALNIDPGDDFRTFLSKAKDLLGCEIEISSLTHSEVSLTDNVYEFLINSQEEHLRPVDVQNTDAASNDQASNESVYVLEDGRQIKQSQLNTLQSESDDSPTKLDVDKIPFIKFAETKDETTKTPESPEVMKIINIAQTPPSRFKDESNYYKPNFSNTLPFKAVRGHFINYNQSGINVYKPRKNFIQSYRPTLNKEAMTFDDIASMSRNQVVNLLKDSPVIRTIDIIGVEEDKVKSKHVRKTDPCKSMTKKLYTSENRGCVDVTMSLGRVNGNNCCICKEMIENKLDEIYLFNSEDQKAYRSSPKKELATPLKIICKGCLKTYFKFCIELLSEKTLGEDEFLIIKRNQQYLYKNIIPLPNKITETREETVSGNKELKETKPQQDIIMEVEDETKVEDDKICAKDIIQNDDEQSLNKEDVIIIPDTIQDVTTKGAIKTTNKAVNQETGSSTSNVKLNAINNESHNEREQSLKDDPKTSGLEKYDDVEFLDDLDDQVSNLITEDRGLKCRFCGKVFRDASQAIEHGTEHRLVAENVYPCPLCEYGYETFAWLRGHMYSKHTYNVTKEPPRQVLTPTPSLPSGSGSGSPAKSGAESPVARRTRSAAGRKRPSSKAPKDKKAKKIKTSKKTENPIEKEEHTANKEEENVASVDCLKLSKTRTCMCPFCNRSFMSKETLAAHEARKCKNPKILVTKKKLPPVKVFGDAPIKMIKKDDHILQKLDGRKRPRPINPKLMTCDDCGATFNSKVRLKFHIPFHNGSAHLTPEGRYLCKQCSPAAVEATFSTEAELFDHVHFTHGKRRRWACTVEGCLKTFFMRAMLMKHGRTHTDTRPYICSECGKRFLDKQTLDEHGVTHLQTKPFQCHVCQKQLTRRSRLRMHVRAHDDVLAPRALRVCLACRRAFVDLPRAQEHASTSECAAKIQKEENGNISLQPSPEGGVMPSDQQNRASDQPVETEDRRMMQNGIFIPRDSEEVQRMMEEMTAETKRLISVVETAKVFRCEYCEDVFYMADSLNGHRKTHAGVMNPFTCHICKVSFPTYSRCTTHKTTHGFYKRVGDSQEQTEGGVILETGGGIVGYGDFPVAKHFLCQDCGRSYLHWTYLQVHRRMKHPTGDAIYTCADCSLTFPNSWGLAYHRKKTHGRNSGNDGPKENANKNSDTKFPCRDCGEVYFNRSALYTHRRKTHTARVRQVDKGLGLFACASCSKCYASKPGLEAHLRGQATRACRTATAAPYACARCGAAFAFCAHLARHVLDAHADEASHMCSWCGARFASRSELAAHARSHSPPQRAHVCRVCGRCFRTASMRAEHARTHTGERPYPCDVCGVAFRRSTARNNHRLIHTGERAYGCARCGKTYRIRSDLRAHVKSKHPEQVQVLEMRGLEPDPGDVILQLRLNSIALEEVADIKKVSFSKGSPDLVLSGDLASLENLQNVQDERGRVWSERVMAAVAECLPQSAVDGYREFDAQNAWRHIQEMSRRERLHPKSRDGIDLHYGDTDTFHVEIKDVAVEELTQLLGGILTSDGTGVLLTSGQFVPFDAALTEPDKQKKNAVENTKSFQDQQSIEEITRSFREDDYYKGLCEELLQENKGPEGLVKYSPCAQYNLEKKAQPTQQVAYNLEGMAQSSQQIQYNLEIMAQKNQQGPGNLEGMTQSAQPGQYNLEEMTQSTQNNQYGLEKMAHPAQQGPYDLEGMAQSTQHGQYNLAEIAQSTQHNQYNLEGLAQVTQQGPYNLEGMAQSSQLGQYNLEGMGPPTQQNQYNLDIMAQATQQGPYNLQKMAQSTQPAQYNLEVMTPSNQLQSYNIEGLTQSTQQIKNNFEEMTQATHQDEYKIEGIAQSIQQSKYNLEAMTQATNLEQYNIEAIAQSTRQSQYTLEEMAQSIQQGKYNLDGMAHATQQHAYKMEGIAQSTKQGQYNLEVMTQATQLKQYNIEGIAQSILQGKYNLEGMAQVSHQDQYNIEGIVQSTQQRQYNLEQMSQSTQQNQYNMEGITQSIQQNMYNIEGIARSTQQNQYNIEGITLSIQHQQYNIEAIANSTQNNQHKIEGIAQTTQQNQYNIKEGIAQSTQQNEYNIEGIAQSTQQNQYNIEGRAQSTQQNQYNIEGIAQSTQQNQYNIEGRAQSTQQNHYTKIEGIAHLTQQNQHKIEEITQSTQQYEDNIEGIAQSTQQNQCNKEGIAQSAQPNQYNIEGIAQSTQKNEYNIEGKAPSTQQKEYNKKGIPKSTQLNEYNIEEIAQSTQKNHYIIEEIAQSTQQYEYNIEGLAQSTQKNEYNIKGIAHSTQQNQHIIEEIAQSTQQNQYNIDKIAQSTQQNEYNNESIEQSTQQNDYNIEGIAQSTQHNQYDIEEIAQSTQHNQYDIEEIAQSTQHNQHKIEEIAQSTQHNQSA